MSAKTLSKTNTLLFSLAGIFKPDIAIRTINPVVFKVTVFPPVLGPVITSVLKFIPKFILIGTTTELSIKGCRAFIKLTSLFLFNRGLVAFKDIE